MYSGRSRDLYLLDEPFNGLDKSIKERTALWVVSETKGKTLVVITHQIQDAEMLGGKILQF